jgi:mannose-6-phosphate isomerase-like protein (cupin superfamily)
MTAHVIRTADVEHYTWGGPNLNDCDGWHLVRTAELSIIEERMPARASEVRHHHVRARQFFYVLEGELSLEVEGAEALIRKDEGVEIGPGVAHQAINRSDSAVRFLVTSQPPSHGDRVNC